MPKRTCDSCRFCVMDLATDDLTRQMHFVLTCRKHGLKAKTTRELPRMAPNGSQKACADLPKAWPDCKQTKTDTAHASATLQRIE